MKRLTYFYGYNIVIAGFVIQAVGIGIYVAFGVFFKPLLVDFEWSRATLSGAQSLALLIAGILGILIGRLSDRFGPRTVMSVSAFFFGLGLVLMSGLNHVWQLFLFYGVVFGIGLSAIDIIALSSTARWFVRRRGIMTGIVKVGTGAGQLVLPLAASLLIAGYGWRTSYVIIGAAAMVLLIFIGQLLRRDPALMGLLPDGNKGLQTQSSKLSETDFYMREALHTRQFWTICFAFGISMVGRFVTGVAIDRIGNRLSMIICLILLILALLWLQLARELWMFYLFAVVYGFGHGGLLTVISPIVAEYFGVRSHGALFGVVFFSTMVGGAIGPVTAGYIFDTTGSYNLAFWICTGVSALALVLVSTLRKTRLNAEE
jgi:MFS family permease